MSTVKQFAEEISQGLNQALPNVNKPVVRKLSLAVGAMLEGQIPEFKAGFATWTDICSSAIAPALLYYTPSMALCTFRRFVPVSELFYVVSKRPSVRAKNRLSNKKFS